MPVVTKVRVGSFVGTAVAAREKLRMPATKTAAPMTISKPATIRWTSALGIGTGKDSRWSRTKPSKRAARKSKGGRAMTPAVPVSFIRCILETVKTTTWVSFCKLTIEVSTGKLAISGTDDDGVGATEDRGGPDR